MEYKKGLLFLKPDEAKFLSLAVVSQLETLNNSISNVAYNWNPETRKQLKEMIAAGMGLKIKMQKLGIDMRDLPPFIDGDETEFLTKQS